MKKGLSIGLLALAALIGIGIISHYVCANYCEYQQGAQDHSSALTGFCTFTRLIGANLEPISVAITAVATGFIGFYTALLYQISKLTESSNRVIERAYVFPDIVIRKSIFHTPSGDAFSPIEVIFTNNGKTPAIIRKLRAYPDILKAPPSELLSHKRAENEIAPGLAITTAPFIEIVKAKLSDAQWGEINRLETTFYILGKIEYDDVFNCRRETGFCWQYDLSSDKFIISQNSKLNYYT